MKPIKFRAISLETYETDVDWVLEWEFVYWYYWYNKTSNAGCIIVELEKESWGMWSWLIQKAIDVDYKTLWQYTWLKDKNNKEIWEGDVVEMEATEKNTMFSNNCFLSEVFINTYWVLLSQWNAKQIVQPDKLWLKWDWVHTWHYLLGENMNLWKEINEWKYICRVIWNIYENPELLNTSIS